MDEQGLTRVLQALGVGRIRKTGGRLICGCPVAPYKHANGVDKNPSFSIVINPSGPSAFNCKACGIAGKKTLSLLYAWKDATGVWKSDIHAMISDQEGGSPRDRIGRLGDYGMACRAKRSSHGESYWQVNGYERKFTDDDIKPWMGEVPQYVIDRGVPPELCRHFELGFDRQHQRLMIPIRDEHGRLVGWSGRAIHAEDSPKYMHAKGMVRDKYLYGERYLVKEVRTGLLMEGFFDVWAFERRGIANALGTMGTALSVTHIAKLKSWFDRVVIFPHNDAKPAPTDQDPNPKPPGLKMAHAYRDALRLSGLQVGIAPTIEGKKDPGEWSDREFDRIEQSLGTVLNELKFCKTRREIGASQETEGIGGY